MDSIMVLREAQAILDTPDNWTVAEAISAAAKRVHPFSPMDRWAAYDAAMARVVKQLPRHPGRWQWERTVVDAWNHAPERVAGDVARVLAQAIAAG